MKIRKDWPAHLWMNRWWAVRALMAFLALAPIFVLEWLLARLINATEWTAEKVSEIGWRWNEHEPLIRLIERITSWVGKPEKRA